MNSLTEIKNTLVGTSRRSENAGKQKQKQKQTSDSKDKDTRSHSIRITKRKENKTKEIKRGLMRDPSSSGSRRSSSGQAAQLLDFSQHPQRAPALPPACPRRRAALHRGQQRRTPRGDAGGCHLNLLLQKWKQSQKGSGK